MGQNVGTPRIYVNLHSWAKSIGLLDEQNPYFSGSHAMSGDGWNTKTEDIRRVFEDGSNPIKAKTWYFKETPHDAVSFITRYKNTIVSQMMEGNCYYAILNHNMASESQRTGSPIEFGLDAYSNATNDYSGEFLITGGINANPSWQQNIMKPEYDGFSLATCEWSGDAHNNIYAAFYSSLDAGETAGSPFPGGEQVKIGGIAFGNYYDFPHSPDLNLTMTIENDGITTQQTKGGATLTNARYTGAPKWGDLGCWELGDGSIASTLSARGGRRVWNLTFSYLSDKQVLPINALGNTVFDTSNASSYDSDDYTDDVNSDYFNSNVLDGEDFFSAVWNKTMGAGNLPFIFNPQGGGSTPDNSPSNFSICRFDQNSLQVKQVAYNKYTISLKIKECW